MMIASASRTVRGYCIRRYKRAAGASESPAVKACMVFMCTTSERGILSAGAISVLKTSIRLSGSRTGVYTCSDRVRRLRFSLDHG